MKAVITVQFDGDMWAERVVFLEPFVAGHGRKRLSGWQIDRAIGSGGVRSAAAR